MLPILILTALAFATARGRQAVAGAPVPALIGLHAVRIAAGAIFVLLYAARRLPGRSPRSQDGATCRWARLRHSSHGWSFAATREAVTLPWPGMHSAFWT